MNRKIQLCNLKLYRDFINFRNFYFFGIKRFRKFYGNNYWKRFIENRRVGINFG